MTRRRYLYQGQHHVWRSRDHRRGLHRAFRPHPASAWRPESLNAWIGTGFLTGSFLFASGAVLSLRPAVAKALALSDLEVNSVYFVGSIFFTLAAYLQLFQAANSGEPASTGQQARGFVPIGWQPHEIGWLSCFLQFIGTILFNVSTFMALVAMHSWLRQDLTIWIPDVFGSVLFLLSGYLAFIETCHRYWSWRPSDLSWWVVFTNLAGCIAFMISAIYAFVPAGGASSAIVALSTTWTLLGAIGFFLGAALLVVEGSVQPKPA